MQRLPNEHLKVNVAGNYAILGETNRTIQAYEEFLDKTAREGPVADGPGDWPGTAAEIKRRRALLIKDIEKRLQELKHETGANK